MKLAKKLSSNVIARKLALNPYDQVGGGPSIIPPPDELVQLLFSDESNIYYTSSEWDSDHDHLLKDNSTPVGNLRNKRKGHCLAFNGVDQYVDTGISLDPASSDASYSVWFRLDDLSEDKIIISAEAGRGVKDTHVLFYDQSAGALVSFIGNAATTVATTIEVAQWYHVVVTWKYTAPSQCIIYINGQSDASEIGQTAVTSDGNLFIATAGSSPPSLPFQGNLFDLRIYDDVLTADEVDYLYTFGQVGTDPTTTNLLLHYWMQEESGSTLYDSSGNGNHASLVNYVSSQRVTDEGVKWSVANEVGVSPRMLFDAVDDYVRVSDFDITTVDPDASGITIASKIYWTNGPDTNEGIFGNGSTIGGTRFQFYIENNLFKLSVSDGLGEIAVGSSISINKSYDLVATARISGGNLELAIYIDGELVDSRVSPTLQSDWSYLANGTWFIGYVNGTTRLFEGIIEYVTVYSGWSSDGSVSNLTRTNHWQNTGSEDVDWIDEEGSVNGTVVGSPATAYFPPLDSSTTQDALGGELTYSGRVPMPGLAKHVGWQGNGTDVRVDLGEAALPATTDFSLIFSYTHKTGDNDWLFSQYSSGTNPGRFFIAANTENGTTGTPNKLIARVGGSNPILGPVDVVAGKTYKVEFTRSGDVYTLTVIDSETGQLQTETAPSSTTLSIDQGGATLLDESTFGGREASGAIGPVSITAGGVTTTYVPIEGTRNVAKLTSDGSDTKIIYDAVSGGTVSTLYSEGDGSWRLPHIENGARWASQNLLPNSMDGAYSAITLESSGETAPREAEGESPIKIVPSIDNLTHALEEPPGFGTIANTGDTATVHIIVKAAGYDYVTLQFTGAATRCTLHVDLTDGSHATFTTNAVIQATTINSLGDGWYYIALSGYPTTYTFGGMELFVNQSAQSGGGGETFAGDGTSGVHFAGWSVYTSASALPHQPTSTNPWSASALIPCDPLGNSPDGNAQNIPVANHPKGVLVDRTGGITSPLDIEIGLDQLMYEEYRTPVRHIVQTPYTAIRARNLELIYSRDSNFIEAR